MEQNEIHQALKKFVEMFEKIINDTETLEADLRHFTLVERREEPKKLEELKKKINEEAQKIDDLWDKFSLTINPMLAYVEHFKKLMQIFGAE